MTFGRSDDKDFSLEWVVKQTENVALSVPVTDKLFIGAGKWARKEWVGTLYPGKTKDKDFLPEYVKHFNAIELNATHYRLEMAQAIKWRKVAEGKQFLFFPKMIQGVSHFGFGNKFNSPEVNALANDFFDVVRLLRPNMGAVLLQMSENFGTNKTDYLVDWLKRFKHNEEIFVSLRDESWYADKGDKIADILRNLKVGFAIEDTAGRRDCVHMQLTIPRTYIRFMAYDHPSDEVRLQEWANRLKEWLNQGLERAYFFIYCTNEDKVPGLIFQMERLMKEK